MLCTLEKISLRKYVWGLWALWTWLSKSLPSLGKFTAIISLNKLLLSSPSLFWDTNNFVCFFWQNRIVHIDFLHSFPFFTPCSLLRNLKDPLFHFPTRSMARSPSQITKGLNITWDVSCMCEQNNTRHPWAVVWGGQRNNLGPIFKQNTCTRARHRKRFWKWSQSNSDLGR